jgi:hypothetical protein
LTQSDDALNLAVLVQARLLSPKIYIVNRLFNSSLGDRLDRTLSSHVTLSVSSLVAPVFAFAAMGSQAIGQLDIFHQTWPMHEEYTDRKTRRKPLTSGMRISPCATSVACKYFDNYRIPCYHVS